MKILNLYCGIGGNRLRWKGHQVTAVDNNPKILALYKKLFPRDKVVCADAHEYLLKHHANFDFVWSSIPCVTHSKLGRALKAPRYPDLKLYEEIIFRVTHSKLGRALKAPRYPDLKLYEEIIFLSSYFKGVFVVENVRPYYKPLITPSIEIGRNLFWTNINPIHPMQKAPIFPALGKHGPDREYIKHKLRWLGLQVDLKGVGQWPRQVVDNCVHPAVGLHILNQIK